MNNEQTKSEDQDRHETWLTHDMTELLKRAIEAKKAFYFKQLGAKAASGTIDDVRTTAGRIQGLQDVEALIEGGMLS